VTNDIDVERKLVRKVIRTLKAANLPVVRVDDREEILEVNGEKEILDAVFGVDEAWMFTESNSWVRITLGNEWDVITDYTVDLEDVLKPVFDYYDKHAE
jgi:hypothetical protein